MTIDPFTIVGAGGHAAVVVDALVACGHSKSSIRIVDDDPSKHGGQLLGCPVTAPMDSQCLAGKLVHIAIGDNRARNRILVRLQQVGARLATIVHPSAAISAWASIGEGSFVAAQAVVSARAQVGRCVIINHGAIVEHDCVVGAFSHIAPRSVLCGEVSTGLGVLVGAGAVFLPKASAGQWAVIGAGSVVPGQIPAGEIWFGIPARIKHD